MSHEGMGDVRMSKERAGESEAMRWEETTGEKKIKMDEEKVT